ncbi:MAG: type I-C CRISPR-associated protein Cas8c/Csd1 [Desulfobacteraceae bacterium 4484_190.1]|nr:MAG: type I-C CRISPR-associated protein Cas8c/Csd1 [Desulfobacteraceae bacterium 4484_190.1]
MLLEKLCEYSRRLEDMSPSGYDKIPIRWLIDLDAQGNFLGFITTTSGRKKDRGKVFFAPAVMKSSNVKASLLVGNGEYVLGIPRDPAKIKRVVECHQAFVQQVHDCATATQNPQVQAVLKFLNTMDLQSLTLPDDFDPSMNLTFQVDGTLLTDLPEVHSYWANLRREHSDESSFGSGQCLVCGKSCIPAKRHPLKVKRIPGGQPSGMTLVSANVSAFESYGLKASQIAPVCQECAEQYAKALNILLEQEDTHLIVGPVVYLFWTRQDVGFNIARLFSKPEPEQVRQLLKSANKGTLYTAMDTEAFYATVLSASGGRVVVRDWLETTVGDIKEHLALWFNLQRITDWDGSEGSPYGLTTLARSLIPQKGDWQRDIPPNVPRTLLKVALQGGPLPSWLLFQAIKRNKAEPQLTRPRATLIKMVLLSQQQNSQEDNMVQLDGENSHPAYLCGRLLAVLERIQKLAVNPKATLIDRCYGTASTAPASVFPRLIRGAQSHLGKLRKEKEGAYHGLQNRLEEICGKLMTFPAVLSLLEQGWFTLGYYHQRAWQRAQAHRRGEQVEAIEELSTNQEQQD